MYDELISKGRRNSLFFILLLTVIAAFYYQTITNLTLNGIGKLKGVIVSKSINSTTKEADSENPQLDILSETSSFTRNVNLTCRKFRRCAKWIVVTTINEPTEQLKYLRDASYGWCLVVVADRKTPTNWTYKDTIVLKVVDQIQLARKYKSLNRIGYGTYLRKLAGYLFAIENGAQQIYETDDDNSPEDGLFGFRYESFRGLQCSDQNLSFINPYAYFGQPSVWPRGYPLELIGQSAKPHVDCRSFTSAQMNAAPSQIPVIQQGLVNGDPDVDAIYRMTRKNSAQTLRIEFDANAPPLLLNRNQYAPINSQNTLFHYAAMFTLLLPLNVTFRECDILRGYIGIRMLHEIDGRVSFMPPNAVQVRNSHSYHDDYIDEKRLFEKVQRFVTSLSQWQCSSDASLANCLIECVQMLVAEKYFAAEQVDFYRDWITDLIRIGYKWPSIVKRDVTKASSQKAFDIFYKSVEQEHSSNANGNELSLVAQQNKQLRVSYVEKKCQVTLSADEFRPCQIDNIVLVTMASNMNEVKEIELKFGLHFPYIVVCMNSFIFNNQNESQISNFLMNSPSLTIVMEKTINEQKLRPYSFRNCLIQAFEIGFRQQTFIIAKYHAKFAYWDEYSLIVPQETPAKNVYDINSVAEENLSDNVYFYRRVIANGLRVMSRPNKQAAAPLHNESDSEMFCRFEKLVAPEAVCANLLKATKNINWHSNDLVSESCANIAPKTVWIPDFHDGPRVDITSLLVHMGHKPILAGTKGRISPYPEALALGEFAGQLSQWVSQSASVSRRDIPEQLIRDNYEFYKTNADFARVDAVVCSFTSAMCEAFIPLNQTIVFNPAHRYNIGRCTQAAWQRLNDNYAKLQAKSKLVAGGMSRYDSEYLMHFSGVQQTHRLYAYGGFYARDIKYEPTKEEILVGPTNGLGSHGLVILQTLKEGQLETGLKFRQVRELYSHYTLGQLANHRAIVLLPYAVMSYSIVDFYIAHIPIFIPSIRLLVQWKQVDDRSVHSGSICGPTEDIVPANDTIHPFNPNDDANEQALAYWLQYADYFQWPFVTVFDSIDELVEKIKRTDLEEISRNMRRFNKYRETDLLDNWCKLLKVANKSPIPKTYEDSLSYFEMNTVQIF